MNRFFRITLPIVVLGGSIIVAKTLFSTAPKADRAPPNPALPVVEVIHAQPVDYPITLHSRGNITPQTQGNLVSEIAGKIIQLSPNFRPGGTFEAGETLIDLDPTDYQHAITIAKADLAQAELTLEKSRAEAEQAAANWKQMGISTPPTALTLHRPQLAQAEASLAAAKARLAQAEHDLARTQIVAPYRGRLLEKQVDLGQFVTRGTPLATLYATDVAEVRLPITDRQSRFLPLPESGASPRVTLTTPSGTHSWQGTIVRSEATVDPRTHQLYVVAEIEDPYRTLTGGGTLKIGQFVTARIEGETLKQVYQIPRNAIRDGDQLLIADSDQRIQRRTVKIIWQQTDHLIASSGLHSGDRIITTALPYAPEGMKIKLENGKR